MFLLFCFPVCICWWFWIDVVFRLGIYWRQNPPKWKPRCMDTAMMSSFYPYFWVLWWLLHPELLVVINRKGLSMLFPSCLELEVGVSTISFLLVIYLLTVLGMEFWTLRLLGKHSYHWATSPHWAHAFKCVCVCLFFFFFLFLYVVVFPGVDHQLSLAFSGWWPMLVTSTFQQ